MEIKKNDWVKFIHFDYAGHKRSSIGIVQYLLKRTVIVLLPTSGHTCKYSNLLERQFDLWEIEYSNILCTAYSQYIP